MSLDAAGSPHSPVRSNARSEIRSLSPWPYAGCAILGVWLATAPAAAAEVPTGIIWSDILSGAAIVILSGLAGGARFRWAPWALGVVGLWLLFAPLVFWAPTPMSYNTNTLVGSLVVTFALLVPGTPSEHHLPGPDTPPGWSYNPSAWTQRSGIIALALVQFFIARHLTAFQLGHIEHVWDPFFGDGTRQVLTSNVSRAFPIADAGLGAASYLVEALTGFLGGTRRWRTMPWAVMLFGVLVVPVGVASVVLLILQPVVVGAWCALCLVTAAITVFMVAPAVDEVLATLQFLGTARRQGRSLWNTFWLGDDSPAGSKEEPQAHGSLASQIADGMELSSIPWNLALCAALGVWLLVAPAVFGSTGHAAANDRLAGALVFTFSVIGFGESARPARWVNVPLGLWLIAAGWLLSGYSSPAQWNAVIVGAAVMLLCIRRGPIRNRFGGWRR